MARRNSPLEALTVRLLPRTVIPRILDHYATWCVVLAYMTSATLSRLRVGLIFDDFDPSMNDSGNTVITFMIIFYVSYCYQRYTSQFEHADSICHSITNACILARNSFSDDGATPDLHRLWRYLNLMHAIAYCGLTSNYNVDNFFEPLVDKYSLLGFGVDKQEERQHLANVRLDAEALRAFGWYEAWSLNIVREQMKIGRIAAPLHAQLNAEILEIGTRVKRLYTYSYQVLPYIYTHLVSASCTVFLLANAFLKGLYFVPGASYTFGLFLPMVNVLMTTLAIFGLLEVGDTVMDPFGSDPEDFAVLHLVEWCAASSLEAIGVSHRTFGVRRASFAPSCFCRSCASHSARCRSRSRLFTASSMSASEYAFDCTSFCMSART